MEIASELQRRKSALPELQARHAELSAELEQISTTIAALGGASNSGPTRGRPPSKSAKAGKAAPNTGGGKTGTRRRPKNEANLPDALTSVLSGKTMSVSDAADAVQKAGYKTTSKHFRTMVNIALLNKKKFKRVERGLYTAI